METNKQPNNPKMPNWVTPKVLWSVIGVLLLIVVVCCVAWYQVIKNTPPINNSGCPTGQVPIGVGSGPNGAKVICGTQSLTDVTANWKTYTNTQYGFQLQYPSDWAYDGISQIYFDKIDPATGKRQYSEGTGIFNLSVINANLDTVYTKIRDGCQAYGTTFKISDPIFSYRSITLGGKNGWEVNCNSEYGAPYTVTILPITSSQTIEINSGYKSSVHNQILSTFKFTN